MHDNALRIPQSKQEEDTRRISLRSIYGETAVGSFNAGQSLLGRRDFERPNGAHVEQDYPKPELKMPAHLILAHARERKGYTLQRMANLCGINIRQYQKFESGERDLEGCAFSLGLKICQTLDLDPFLFV